MGSNPTDPIPCVGRLPVTGTGIAKASRLATSAVDKSMLNWRIADRLILRAHNSQHLFAARGGREIEKSNVRFLRSRASRSPFGRRRNTSVAL